MDAKAKTGSVGVKDVAELAGVSLGTVSNVLNRPEIVREKTRVTVHAAMAQLGFVRNESARQLRAGRSSMVAYLVLDAANPFFADVALGIDEVVRAHGLPLFLCSSNGDVERESEYLDRLIEQRVTGAFITPVAGGPGELAALVRPDLPLVLVDGTATGGELCSVAVDDVEGGMLAVAHLIERGHENIAFVGGPSNNAGPVDMRLRGARSAIAEAGMPEHALTVLDTTALNVEEGRRAGQRLVGRSGALRPTAVFCANDLLALGLLQELTRLDMSVPDDIAIVGYDDIEFAAAAAVPLSSVRRPRRLLGRTAAELLLAEADRTETEHQHRQITFPPELIARESSVRRRRGR